LTQTVEILDESIFTSNAKIFLNQVEINGATTYHAHNFIEIAYVVSGEGFHRLGEKQTECRAGDCFVINYRVPHGFVCQGTMVVCNCVFSLEFIDFTLLGCKDFNKMTRNFMLGNILPLSGLHLSDLKFEDKMNTLHIIVDMYREFTERRTGYIELIRAMLIVLLIEMLRQAEGKLEFTKNIQNNEMEGVLSYMYKTFNQPIHLEEFSMMAFLSPAHFSRQFKHHMGETVTAFRQRLRIGEARRQLLGSMKSVSEIAENVGYHDLKYFTKLFMEYEGCTPTQYRKKDGP